MCVDLHTRVHVYKPHTHTHTAVSACRADSDSPALHEPAACGVLCFFQSFGSCNAKSKQGPRVTCEAALPLPGFLDLLYCTCATASLVMWFSLTGLPCAQIGQVLPSHVGQAAGQARGLPAGSKASLIPSSFSGQGCPSACPLTAQGSQRLLAARWPE